MHSRKLFWRSSVTTLTSSGFQALGILCIHLLQLGSVRGADVIVATPGIGTGNTHALEPFALRELFIPSIRYQQVYAASEFLRDIPEGGIITELIFRSDEEVGRAFITAYPSIQINMSITSRSPDSLSFVFNENVGSQNTTVFPLGALTLGSGGAGTPNTSISLQTPYSYSPAKGNLLLDFMIFSPELPPIAPSTIAGRMDAENNGFGPDTVSRVFAYDVNATSGTADTIGLITFFRVTPIPEPPSSAIVVLGVIPLLILNFSRIRFRCSAGRRH